MERTAKHKHTIIIFSIIAAACAALLAMGIAKNADGQCSPDDLLCISTP